MAKKKIKNNTTPAKRVNNTEHAFADHVSNIPKLQNDSNQGSCCRFVSLHVVRYISIHLSGSFVVYFSM